MKSWFKSLASTIVVLGLLFVPALAAQAAAGPTLTFWHYWTDRDQLIRDLAQQYEKMTGVRIDVQLYPGDGYNNKLQAASQANRLPDIIGWTGGGGEALSRYILAGQIVDLSKELKSGWASSFPSVYLDQFHYAQGNRWGVPAGTYGVPVDINDMLILYNKSLFQKAGLDPNKPPRTWREFIQAGKQLKAHGIVPFAPGFGSWALGSFMSVYAENLVGRANLEKTYLGKATYASIPEWKQVFGVFEELRDSGILAQGVTSLTVPDSERMFVTGQAAMIFDGSWAIGVFKSMDPGFKDYGAFMPPAYPGAKHKLLIPGGIGASLVVNKHSAHVQQAIDFVRWFTAKEQMKRYATSSLNLPANREVQIGAENPVLQDFIAAMGDVEPPFPQYEAAAVQDAIQKGLQAILIGQSTPAQLVSQIDQLKKKLK